jgi:hypothetical protein
MFRIYENRNTRLTTYRFHFGPEETERRNIVGLVFKLKLVELALHLRTVWTTGEPIEFQHQISIERR